jgi:hypothetical protein
MLGLQDYQLGRRQNEMAGDLKSGELTLRMLGSVGWPFGWEQPIFQLEVRLTTPIADAVARQLRDELSSLIHDEEHESLSPMKQPLNSMQRPPHILGPSAMILSQKEIVTSMDEIKYLDAVIEHVHARVFGPNKLNWRITNDSASVDLPGGIYFRLKYEERQPGEAVWELVSSRYPSDFTVAMASNPEHERSRLSMHKLQGHSVARVNQVFEEIVAEPKRKQLADVLEKLKQGS